MCNNVGAGKDEQFSEREMVFSIRVASGGPNTSAQPVTTLRVRKSEQTPGNKGCFGPFGPQNFKGTMYFSTEPILSTLFSLVTADKNDPNWEKQSPPWQLRYLGQPEIGEKRPTLVRSCYDIACR